MNQLDQLKQYTTVVADTGNFSRAAHLWNVASRQSNGDDVAELRDDSDVFWKNLEMT